MKESLSNYLYILAIVATGILVIVLLFWMISAKMFTFALSMRYIRKRVITWLSLLGVALGVIVLIVVISVMDGFHEEFITRLQGILSHLTITVRSNAKNFSQLEQEIRNTPHVIGCAPHLRGVILVATNQYYVGGIVMGIDYQKEYEVGNLKSFLVTPYKETQIQAEQILEDNIRLNMTAILSWEVLGIKSGANQTIFSQQERIVCKRIYTLRPKITSWNQVERQTHEFIGYVIDSQKKIVYGEFLTKQEVSQLPSMDKKVQSQWQLYFNEIALQFNSRNVPEYMAFFSKNFKFGASSLDIENPFAYIRAREETNQKIRPVLIGYELMRQLGLKYGEDIILMTGRRDPQTGKMNAYDEKFKIVGAFKSGWQEIDAHVIYAQRQDLIDFFQFSNDINEISIALDSYDNAEQVLKNLDAKYNPQTIDFYAKDYQIQTWEEMRKSLLSAIRIERIVMFIIVFLIVVLAIISIMIMLILLVTEKTKDIGILKAIGASNPNIMRIFILNGLFISSFGSLLGAISGILFSLHINSIADWLFEWTGFRLFPRDVYYLEQIPVALDYSTVVMILVSTLFLTVFFCAIPAFKAARLDAIEALNSEFPSIKMWASRRKNIQPLLSAGSRIFFGVENLAKEYIMGHQTLRILDNLNLEVKQGEILVILGSSGAGKSTLLHIMGLLDTPTEGAVYYQGVGLNAYSAQHQARIRNETIGFIFQLYHLLPEFTALENVMISAMIYYNVWEWHKHQAEIQKRAIELLNKVGLSQRLSHRPEQLSGGERQRVAIARALIMNPKIVLCDEPTGNLDEDTSLTIQNLIWQLNAQMGQTFVIVTHEERMARRGDRVFRLEYGHLHPLETAK